MHYITIMFKFNIYKETKDQKQNGLSQISYLKSHILCTMQTFKREKPLKQKNKKTKKIKKSNKHKD